MTFRKKDPEVVTIFILGANGEVRQRHYRVPKYHDFITTLQVRCAFVLSSSLMLSFIYQKHMERFH
jgi:hypothetical protein